MKKTKNYLFFWKEFLSQWKIEPFQCDGYVYNCCEQWMMHQKALLFGDHRIAELIMEAEHPREQKALGRKVEGFDPKVWDKHKSDIVYKGNLLRFTQNHKSWRMLRRTHPLVLVEASPFDKIWGIGMLETDYGVEIPSNWKGENLLGYTLTKVRNDLIDLGW